MPEIDAEAVRVDGEQRPRVRYNQVIQLRPEWLSRGDTLTVEFTGNWVMVDNDRPRDPGRPIRRMLVTGYVVEEVELDA